MVNLNPESFKLRVMGILSIVPYKSQIVLFYDNNVSTSRVQYLQETRIFIDLPNSQPDCKLHKNSQVSRFLQ